MSREESLRRIVRGMVDQKPPSGDVAVIVLALQDLQRALGWDNQRMGDAMWGLHDYMDERFLATLREVQP